MPRVLDDAQPQVHNLAVERDPFGAEGEATWLGPVTRDFAQTRLIRNPTALGHRESSLPPFLHHTTTFFSPVAASQRMSPPPNSPKAYLQKEAKARRALETRFGMALSETEVAISGGVSYKFDLVSPNTKIVGEIRASGLPARGRLRSTQIAEMSEACLFLLGAKDVERRLLVFTEREFYEPFIRTRQAQAATSMGIEFLHVEV